MGQGKNIFSPGKVTFTTFHSFLEKGSETSMEEEESPEEENKKIILPALSLSWNLYVELQPDCLERPIKGTQQHPDEPESII